MNLQFTHNGTTYRLMFNYPRVARRADDMTPNHRLAKIGQTNAILLRQGGTSWEPIAQGWSRRAACETAPFCRETGRKHSLARALAPFDKTFRHIAWMAYLNRGQR